jgi:hypothetical protein
MGQDELDLIMSLLYLFSILLFLLYSTRRLCFEHSRTTAPQLPASSSLITIFSTNCDHLNDPQQTDLGDDHREKSTLTWC